MFVCVSPKSVVPYAYKTPVEQEQIETQKTNILSLFAALDKNGDGSITRAEFIHGIRQNADLKSLFHLPVGKIKLCPCIVIMSIYGN